MPTRVPRSFAVIALMLLPLLLFASIRHEITVKSASSQQNLALVNAEIGSIHFQLSCVLSDHDCRTPKNGVYIASQVPVDKSVYEDCANINLYERSSDGQLGQLIGTFCVLGDEAASILLDGKP
jgi:hypothetical protein